MTEKAILELSSQRARAPPSDHDPQRLLGRLHQGRSGVKDEGSGQVTTAYLDYIAAQSTAQEFVQLPGDIESCLFRITPEVGEDLLGGGLADNAPGVNIRVTD